MDLRLNYRKIFPYAKNIQLFESLFYLDKIKNRKKLKMTNFNEFNIIGDVKSGSDGSMFIVEVKQMPSMILLMKMILKNNYNDRILSEIKILDKLQGNNNIIILLDYFCDNNAYYLITEYCDGSDLYEYLDQEGYISEKSACNIFYQTCLSIKHCHDNNIIHRDIKPDNLVFNKYDNDNNIIIKLIDFGYSVMVNNNDDKINGYYGSLTFMAPEIINHKFYDKSIDIWSLGVLLYDMICGNTPFEEDTELLTIENIINLRIDFPDFISESVKDLISKILLKKPKKRLSLDQILEHPWLTETKGIISNINK
jgi:serine/threonine protein kinase